MEAPKHVLWSCKNNIYNVRFYNSFLLALKTMVDYRSRPISKILDSVGEIMVLNHGKFSQGYVLAKRRLS